MRRAVVSLCCGLLFLALAPAAFAAKRVAFVVGIDAYDNLSFERYSHAGICELWGPGRA